MIELIDPKTELRFVPASEKDSENPTVFIVRPASNRHAIKSLNLFEEKINPSSGKIERYFSDDDSWLDYLSARIVRIENVALKNESGEKDAKTIEGAKEIREALADMPEIVGSELFMYLVTTSKMTGKQIKN